MSDADRYGTTLPKNHDPETGLTTCACGRTYRTRVPRFPEDGDCLACVSRFTFVARRRQRRRDAEHAAATFDDGDMVGFLRDCTIGPR